MGDSISTETLNKIKERYSESRNDTVNILCISAAIFGYSLAMDRIKFLEEEISCLNKKLESKNKEDSTYY